MVIFLITFAIALLFATGADRNIGRHKILFVIFSLLSIIVLSALAGVRDVGVGTDTSTYLFPEFERITNYHYSLATLLALHGGDILFWSLNYLLVTVFGDFNLVMFFIEFIIVGLFYIFAFQLKKTRNVSIWFSMLIFCCLFYVESYNTMRQCIAVGIVAVSLSFAFKEKWIIFAVLTVVAIGFHSTAVAAIVIPVIYLLVKKSRHPVLFVSLTVGLVSVAAVFYPQLLSYMVSHGMLSPHYLLYTTNYVRATTNFSLTLIALNTFCIIIYAFIWKHIKKNEINCYLLFAMAIMEYIFYFLNGVVSSAYRIGLYYGITSQMYLIPATGNFLKAGNKDVTKVVWMLFLIGYFIYKLVFIGWSGVYPYTSSILGI